MKKLILGFLLFSTAVFAETPIPAPTLNSSVSITTGNTFQTILAAANRRSITIENNNATDSCWITVDGNASPTKATSILLLAGGAYGRYYPFTPNAAIQGTCSSNGDTIYVDSQ